MAPGLPFTPHSNDDLVTALLLLDDMTEENGALEVLAGSHRGIRCTLWHNGAFTGSIEETVADEMQSRSALCLGEAGSVCLMHATRPWLEAKSLEHAADALHLRLLGRGCGAAGAEPGAEQARRPARARRAHGTRALRVSR